MSSKHVVVQGATIKCEHSVDPSKTDKLKVKSHSKHYANDKEGSDKLIATDKEIGQTLDANTFGKCKLQPLGNGDYNICQCKVQKWSGCYKKVTLSNGGKILTENSKGTCPLGTPDCLSVVKHGQTGEPSNKQAKDNPNKDNPVNNTKKVAEQMDEENCDSIIAI